MADKGPFSEVVVSDLQKKLAKKATFETAVKGLTTIVQNEYFSAPPALQRQIFEAVTRTATLLQTRYTTRGFWLAGLGLFNAMQAVVRKPLEAKQLQMYITKAKEFVGEQTSERETSQEDHQSRSGAAGSSPFLFEGQLSSGATPPRPAWLVAQTAHFSLLSDLHEESLPRNESEQEPLDGAEHRNGLQRIEQELLQMAEDVVRTGQEGMATNDDIEMDRQERQEDGEVPSSIEQDSVIGRVWGSASGQDTTVGGDQETETTGQSAPSEGGVREGNGDTSGDRDAESPSGSLAERNVPTAREGLGEEPLPRTESGVSVGAREWDPLVRERARLARERLQALLAAIRGPSDGDVPGRIPDYLEVMRAAMMQARNDEIPGLEEALQATMQDVPRGPPPASKELVANLPKVKVTGEVLSCLEAGTQCTVCREAYAEGEVMQQLPCKHTFHPECIAPWLEVHNSCPLCRFEMRTDDEEYERRKEREKEEREERRGVENALRQGEHMFM